MLAQFAEQPRVLDGDDGLVGEVRYQLDLLFGEGPTFDCENCNDPDRLSVRAASELPARCGSLRCLTRIAELVIGLV